MARDQFNSKQFHPLPRGAEIRRSGDWRRRLGHTTFNLNTTLLTTRFSPVSRFPLHVSVISIVVVHADDDQHLIASCLIHPLKYSSGLSKCPSSGLLSHVCDAALRLSALAIQCPLRWVWLFACLSYAKCLL